MWSESHLIYHKHDKVREHKIWKKCFSIIILLIGKNKQQFKQQFKAEQFATVFLRSVNKKWHGNINFLYQSWLLRFFFNYFVLRTKALWKADSFVVLRFTKYETHPVSKSSKRSKLIQSFVIAKFSWNLTKILAKHF